MNTYQVQILSKGKDITLLAEEEIRGLKAATERGKTFPEASYFGITPIAGNLAGCKYAWYKFSTGVWQQVTYTHFQQRLRQAQANTPR